MKKSNHNMVHYDSKEDVLGVYLKKEREEEFVELAPGVIVEFDKKGNVIGFEILDASHVLRPFLRSREKAKRTPAYAR